MEGTYSLFLWLFSSQCLLTGTYKLKLILSVFMAYCFQTCKDHSAPQTTPEILFTPPRVDLPCVVDVFLIAEKAGVLLVKPSMSRLARSRAPPPLDLPLRLYVQSPESKIHLVFVHTQTENLLTW